MDSQHDVAVKERFVHNVVLGMSRTRAAAEAGVTHNLESGAQSLMKDEFVLNLLTAYKTEIESRLSVDRDKLTGMTMDAFDVAKLQGDAKAMITAVQELANIHGLHSPQEIKVTRTNELGVKALEAVRLLPEKDLLALAAPLDETPLEAEFVELETK
jgi:hypothetical protein